MKFSIFLQKISPRTESDGHETRHTLQTEYGPAQALLPSICGPSALTVLIFAFVASRNPTDLFALAFPHFITFCSCSSVHESRSTDLTLLIWVPMPR